MPAARPPEWGEPRLTDTNNWVTTASCRCEVFLSYDNRKLGWCCDSHTFADLVSGEVKLREAIKGESR
jgi:hypothetical protein